MTVKTVHPKEFATLSLPAGARPWVFSRSKRALDVALCLLALPVWLPLVAALALMVRRDGGPAFFGHRRVGRNRRAFTCWKLRSMVPDAEARLRALVQSDPRSAQDWAAGCKLSDDPRVTRFGRFLRRTSLDELPQLWNVLRGDMSLVGPRPVTSDELVRYGAAVGGYLAVRPGLTGLWQVSGRNALCYAQRVALDCRYVSAATVRTDLHVLLLTLAEVLRRGGL